MARVSGCRGDRADIHSSGAAPELLYCRRSGRTMKLGYFNLVCALLSVAGSLLWLWLGEAVSGLVWFAASLVWLTVGLWRLQSNRVEPSPFHRLARRISRLLMWT